MVRYTCLYIGDQSSVPERNAADTHREAGGDDDVAVAADDAEIQQQVRRRRRNAFADHLAARRSRTGRRHAAGGCGSGLGDS